MRRPVIGICAALERARWSVWDQCANLLPRNYSDAVVRAGAMAVMLPVDAQLERDPAQALELVDGLLLAGGADIDPTVYGADPQPQTTGTVPERDRFEIALTRAALARDMPLLGICRGMQLLNVTLGGTLVQDLPTALGHGNHRRALGTFEGTDHDVELSEGSLVRALAGAAIHATKSHHHQGVDVLGKGLRVTGRSVIDGLVEAIEVQGARFALGVQWHPEADEDSAMIAGLVAAAAAGRTLV